MIDTVKTTETKTFKNPNFMLIHKTVLDKSENRTIEDMIGQNEL